MDHLMNMGKKLFKNSMSGDTNHNNNAGYPNYDSNPPYNIGPNNPYSNYGPMDYGQSNYGAPVYGHQGYVSQNYASGFGGYGTPSGPAYGYAAGIPPTSAPNYGSGVPPQGNHGHSMNILKAFDRDGDGNITENDFVIAARQMGLGFLGESLARTTFKKFDKNRNGRLEMSEAFGAIGTLKGMGGHKHH